MANSEKAGRNKGAGQDSIIDKIVKDPAKPPALRAVTGFVGKSDRPKCLRIYDTPTLDKYFEISEDDVISQTPISSDQSLFGLSYSLVLIRQDVVLPLTMPVYPEVRGNFILCGPITSRFLGAAAPNFLPSTGTAYALRMSWTSWGCGPGCCYTSSYPDINKPCNPQMED